MKYSKHNNISLLDRNLKKLDKNLRFKIYSNLSSKKNKSNKEGIEAYLETFEFENLISTKSNERDFIFNKKLFKAEEKVNIKKSDEFPIIKGNVDTDNFIKKYEKIFEINSSNIEKMNELEITFKDLILNYQERGFDFSDLNRIKNIFDQSLLLIENEKIDKFCIDNPKEISMKGFLFLNNLYKLILKIINKGINSENVLIRNNEDFTNFSNDKKIELLEIMKTKENLEKGIRKLKKYLNFLKIDSLEKKNTLPNIKSKKVNKFNQKKDDHLKTEINNEQKFISINENNLAIENNYEIKLKQNNNKKDSKYINLNIKENPNDRLKMIDSIYEIIKAKNDSINLNEKFNEYLTLFNNERLNLNSKNKINSYQMKYDIMKILEDTQTIITKYNFNSIYKDVDISLRKIIDKMKIFDKKINSMSVKYIATFQ